jgi:membrane protein DedA with SNARE-associated domain
MDNKEKKIKKTKNNKIEVVKDNFGKDIQVQKNITLKERSLYKPLLIIFGLTILAQIIIFPNTVFDAMSQPIPSILNYIRLMAAVFVSSAATVLIILPLPVTFADALLLGIYTTTNQTLLYTGGLALAMIISDVFWAYIGYKFTYVLRNLFARKAKSADVKTTNNRLGKYGNLAVFVFASTPLPFTVAVYAAGALKINMWSFLLAVLVGRFIRHGFFFGLVEVFGLSIEQFLDILGNLFVILL